MFAKIAVAVAALALAGVAHAAQHVDLEAAQQRAEQGAAPLGVAANIPLAAQDRITSHLLGEAMQQAETGMGSTPSRDPAPVPGGVRVQSTPQPIFGIAEGQQRAVTGAGYTPDFTRAAR